MTQAELARRMQVSDMWVARRLVGRVSWSIDELALAAGALGIPLSDLVGGTE